MLTPATLVIDGSADGLVNLIIVLVVLAVFVIIGVAIAKWISRQ